MNSQLTTVLKRKPYLTWDIKDTAELSELSIVEHILNYGDWDDVLQIITVLGIEKMSKLFHESILKPRSNYRPQTINFFKLFFQRHSQ